MARNSPSEAPAPRARLFLALDPPAAARSELARWRDELCAGRDDLRPVPAGALHVTLVFLGSRPEGEIERVAEVAFEPIADLAAVDLEPAAVRPLPPRRPRLFALDLDDAGGGCSELQRRAEAALAAEGLHRPERREFWPHMTLARVRRDRRAGPLEPAGDPPGRFRAGDVVLYRSLLSPRGARYEPLARLVLR